MKTLLCNQEFNIDDVIYIDGGSYKVKTKLKVDGSFKYELDFVFI